MPHFFINSKAVEDNKILISDTDNYRHIAKSLRAKVGERILFIDENEMQYESVIEDISSNTITSVINKSYKSRRKLPFNLYLAQVPLRSDAQNMIIEKATELGIAGVYPILSDNCSLNKKVIENKITKWQRIMVESSKQCERANIPECYDLTSIKNLFNSKKFDYIFAFCERIAKNTFKDFLNINSNLFNSGTNILIIIGPEGGFSDSEFEYFKANSIPMLTLGDLILRAETAVVVAIGNIIYEYNNNRKN